MPYFHIQTGLRGCYLPDSSYCVYVKTRRELKDAIAREAERYRDSGYVGASQKSVAWLAATAWRNSKTKASYLPFALPLAPAHSPKNYWEAIFVSNATRDDYRAYLGEAS